MIDAYLGFLLFVLLKISGGAIIDGTKPLAPKSDAALDLLASRKYCGYQHVDDYNRENDNISIDEFPWIAQLLYGQDKKVLCTGSLINKRYVLVTAHCLVSGRTPLTGVRLGDFNVTSDKDCIKHRDFGEECSDPAEVFEIEETIPHPEFNGSYDNGNDIGLVRLSRDVQYSEYVRPICLPNQESVELRDDEELAVSGWGTLGDFKNLTEIKKKISVKLVALDECQEKFKTVRVTVGPNVLCALERNFVTCRGDSGGPLMRSVKNQWEAIGVLSFGLRCDRGYPALYTDILKYINWIKENLRK
ncbi:hypothetical protein RI129_007831 [Pyrocoelia pectoralis]|uniref:Peptidase S1 domain-containing protein n=1 Tax=Pyrocoelia pectoralis TaxID=417401 RepID=A0AAN7ZN60_9COLE